MLELTLAGLQNATDWKAAGVATPGYNVATMRQKTQNTPAWLHFGAGNIFRGFVAALQHNLLEQGLADTGIIAVESFDFDIIEQIYKPYDDLALLVTLRADGGMDQAVIASIAQGLTTQGGDLDLLRRYFENPALQMVSFTITEKGYALRNMDGALLPVTEQDMQKGPQAPVHVMAVLTALMLARYKAGAPPLALVSMDNCSHNGDRLQGAVLEIARAWQQAGFADAAFVDYLSDSKRVGFPWSMIDKITPRPAEVVQNRLAEEGLAGMKPIITSRGTFIAPFVNAEAAQYLVIEDAFPNGRPPLERSGVYITDRDTVNKVERMKVTTCLNPLHTALAVCGCLLGYDTIAAEMRDPQLVALTKRIGYVEGLPVVTDPGILDPRAFIDEVVEERLPNPFIPDTPQRIATDTSQKVGIRFGETIKAYLATPGLSVNTLVGIPLALAAWLRYLLGVDDQLAPMPVSDDPMLSELQAALAGVVVGKPETAEGKLAPILQNATLFGTNLCTAGLAGRIEEDFTRMLTGAGAVRALLCEKFPG